MELSGTEAHTLEIEGSIAEAPRVPSGLEAIRSSEGVEASVLFFSMRGLGMTQPISVGPRFDYGEALFRIGVVLDGRPAWLAVACDLDRSIVRALGGVLVRYPVRTATIEVTATRAASRTDAGAIDIAIGARGESPAPTPPRPLLVRDGASLFRIPWREDPAPVRHVVDVEIRTDDLSRATFGASTTYRTKGLAHEGRVHRCGIATRLR